MKKVQYAIQFYESDISHWPFFKFSQWMLVVCYTFLWSFYLVEPYNLTKLTNETLLYKVQHYFDKLFEDKFLYFKVQTRWRSGTNSIFEKLNFPVQQKKVQIVVCLYATALRVYWQMDANQIVSRRITIVLLKRQNQRMERTQSINILLTNTNIS